MQPEGALGGRVIIDRGAPDPQRAAPEGPADAKARLGHQRHVQDPRRAAGQILRAGIAAEQELFGRRDPRVDLRAAVRPDAVVARSQRQGARAQQKPTPCHAAVDHHGPPFHASWGLVRPLHPM